jgi:hypothetical protein
VGTPRKAREDGRERPFVARLCPPYKRLGYLIRSRMLT